MAQDIHVGAGIAEKSPITNPAGVYVLRDDEKNEIARMVAAYHPKFGTVQADAAVRAGYKWERDATPEEIAGPHFGNVLPADQFSQGAQVRADAVPRHEFEALAATMKSQQEIIDQLRGAQTVPAAGAVEAVEPQDLGQELLNPEGDVNAVPGSAESAGTDATEDSKKSNKK